MFTAVAAMALSPLLPAPILAVQAAAKTPTPVRIDAGSASSYVDASGNTWQADTNATGGHSISRSNRIALTPDPTLYHTERWGLSAYNIPVANGSYDVLLHFAETYSGITGPGQRVFGVNVNGTSLGNLDVFAQAGGANRALTETVPVTVTNGTISVAFTKITQETMINALEVLPVAPVATDCSKTLQSLVDAAPAGTLLKVPACNYYETVRISRPVTLDGQGHAAIYGSDVWAAWSASTATWVSAQSVPTFDTLNQGVCLNASSNQCNWPEEVFRDGTPLSQVAQGTIPHSGQFVLDGARHVILGDTPVGHNLSIATRTRWIDTEADDVTIQGFSFWHAANNAQTGAIGNQNRNGWTLQNNKLYYAHGGIVSIGGATNAGTQTRVLNNQIAGSGVEGINGYLNNNTLIQGNTIYSNNLAGFDWVNWAGGGIKVASFTNLTVDSNQMYSNQGPGMWCDVGCQGVTLSNNKVHDNNGPNLMFEISTNAAVFGNSVWNVPAGQPAIFISSSAGATVYNNVIDAPLGIVVFEANRTDMPSSGVVNTSVHDNTVVAPGDSTLALVWGDYGNGHITSPAANNHGQNNRFWYPTAEDAQMRFQWGQQQFGSLAGSAATPGNAGGTYLSTTTETSTLAGAGIPVS